jgi:hypothetical protein
MNQALEDWKNRCEYSRQCTSFHKMSYECGLDQTQCVLYGLYDRIEKKRLEELKGLEKVLTTISNTDGTSYEGA